MLPVLHSRISAVSGLEHEHESPVERLLVDILLDELMCHRRGIVDTRQVNQVKKDLPYKPGHQHASCVQQWPASTRCDHGGGKRVDINADAHHIRSLNGYYQFVQNIQVIVSV